MLEHTATHCNTLQHTATHRIRNVTPVSTGWRRRIWCLIFTGHFSQKSHIIRGSCAERTLQQVRRMPKAFHELSSPYKTYQFASNSRAICHVIHSWCDVIAPYMRHDSLICDIQQATGNSNWAMCNRTHPYVRRASLICATWLTHWCDVTHLYMWHDSLISATCNRQQAIQVELYVMWLTRMCDVTHSYVWRDSSICVT